MKEQKKKMKKLREASQFVRHGDVAESARRSQQPHPPRTTQEEEGSKTKTQKTKGEQIPRLGQS